jgi:hypothetical protein
MVTPWALGHSTLNNLIAAWAKTIGMAAGDNGMKVIVHSVVQHSVVWGRTAKVARHVCKMVLKGGVAWRRV